MNAIVNKEYNKIFNIEMIIEKLFIMNGAASYNNPVNAKYGKEQQ